jgi:hypothetical protein
MSDCKPATTPVHTKAKLPSDVGEPVADLTFYRSIVGALQYLTLTWPDLTYAVQQACLHMHDPKDVHWMFVKRILRYVAAQCARVSNFIAPLRQHSRAIPTPTGRAALTRDVRRPGSVCSWVTCWCHGRPNASPSSPGRARRLSTEVWPTSRQNAVGFIIFLASFCNRCPRRQSCTATTSRPST